MQEGQIYFETPRGKVVAVRAKNGRLTWAIQWNPGFGPGFTQAFIRAQAIFAQEVAKHMDQYVPFTSGTLKNSVNLGSDYERGILVYATPYARRQYYLHPMGEGIKDLHRGSYWGQRCDADFHPFFVRFARRAVQKELKNS